MRLVLDTDVVVAAFRSPSGASAELLRMARARRLTMLASVPLFLEYEAICTLPEHLKAAGLSAAVARQFFDALAIVIEPIEPHFMWCPQLRDPGDEMVLEAAVNGRADWLVSFNQRDFATAPATFGIKLLLPAEALERLR
jgi:putative PIN family toxin of toxin-antitoxin system